MFTFFGNRRRTAAQRNAALADITVWSRTAWLDHWHSQHAPELQAELDAFLPIAMKHAQANEHLQGSYSAMITRHILLGIVASGSHDTADLEDALGVPMPVEMSK